MTPRQLSDLMTSRLALRSACDSDCDTLRALLTDPLVRRYLCDNRTLTRDEVAVLLADTIAHGPAGMGMWLAYQADQMVGCLAIHPVSAGVVAYAPQLAGEVEPTIALHPSAWGRGLATEMLTAALTYAFERLGIDHLSAVVAEPNQASHRLMTRMGFTPTEITLGACHP